MFTVAERDAARDRVLELAEGDPRVVAGAVVGSLALTDGDRWSDLDLTFAVADDVPVEDVLEEWTEHVVADLRGTQLFDLPSGPTIYRVFLLPGCLQLDLSFTPAAAFAPAGPRFRLLFGDAGEPAPRATRPTSELLGYAVHHALRAYVCIERDRPWQAERWIGGIRTETIALACRRRGLPEAEGRGVDDLPDEVLARFDDALVRSLDPPALRRALRAAVDALLAETDEARELADAVEQRLRELVA